jgi:hypothetical protein
MHHIIINKDFQSRLSITWKTFGHYQIKAMSFKQIWLMLSQGAKGSKNTICHFKKRHVHQKISKPKYCSSSNQMKISYFIGYQPKQCSSRKSKFVFFLLRIEWCKTSEININSTLIYRSVSFERYLFISLKFPKYLCTASISRIDNGWK